MTSEIGSALATVVIPAHDEERGIGRLLRALDTSATEAGRIRVIVVANGCSDRTADVARAHDGVEVIELAEGNKQRAMRAGAALVEDFPVVYVDADVVVSAASVAQLVAGLTGPVLATAPERRLDLDGAALLVRSYYRVWSALPHVRSGLFGRGVIALSREGQQRVANLPLYLSDDLALSESFAPPERRVVPAAAVRVIGPRTVRDLLQRRQRIIAGNREFDDIEERSTPREQTGARTLVAIVRSQPRLLLDLPAFVGVTLAARTGLARRRGTVTWLRDESSRRSD